MSNSNKNIILTIQYDGSRYSGWQKQGNTTNTIQGKLEQVLNNLYTSEEGYIEIHGSGRTDIGVHAKGQVSNFHLLTDKDALTIKDEINLELPLDITITEAKFAKGRFHSRLNAIKKTYTYTIDTNKKQDCFAHKYNYHCPCNLNIAKMKTLAKTLTGQHDFKEFCDTKRMKKSTTRAIHSIEITNNENVIEISFSGNGFLYHMVRLLAGTLLLAGKGEIDSDIPFESIKRKDIALLPSKGLCLKKVEY